MVGICLHMLCLAQPTAAYMLLRRAPTPVTSHSIWHSAADSTFHYGPTSPSAFCKWITCERRRLAAAGITFVSPPESSLTPAKSSRSTMQTRQFGSTGVKVPVIGQGTWQMRKDGLEALNTGIKLGMTHIDTAEMYTGSEEVIAEAIRGNRKKVFLVSKVLPSNTSYNGTLRACEGSLKRLRTDYLDVY